ncbi:hypothetical protein Mpsy_0402 [Methanolobus psychrophilus R15]|nr:hypothetical protein Mpsy_0402 [Methanolobus psychrophilus R15]
MAYMKIFFTVNEPAEPLNGYHTFDCTSIFCEPACNYF